MEKSEAAYQKHMGISERIYIEEALERGDKFIDIARFLEKDPTTISKEIRKHRVLKKRTTTKGKPIALSVMAASCDISAMKLAATITAPDASGTDATGAVPSTSLSCAPSCKGHRVSVTGARTGRCAATTNTITGAAC